MEAQSEKTPNESEKDCSGNKDNMNESTQASIKTNLGKNLTADEGDQATTSEYLSVRNSLENICTDFSSQGDMTTPSEENNGNVDTSGDVFTKAQDELSSKTNVAADRRSAKTLIRGVFQLICFIFITAAKAMSLWFKQVVHASFCMLFFLAVKLLPKHFRKAVDLTLYLTVFLSVCVCITRLFLYLRKASEDALDESVAEENPDLPQTTGKKAEMETPDEKGQGIHGNVVEEELNELVQSEINTNILKDLERTETPAVIQARQHRKKAKQSRGKGKKQKTSSNDQERNEAEGENVNIGNPQSLDQRQNSASVIEDALDQGDKKEHQGLCETEIEDEKAEYIDPEEEHCYFAEEMTEDWFPSPGRQNLASINPAQSEKAQSEEAQYSEELPKENESERRQVPGLLFGEDIQLQDYVLDEMVTVILESQPWYKFNFWYGKLVKVLTTAGRASYDFRPDGVHIKEKHQRKIGQLAAKDLIEKYGSDTEVINAVQDESKVSKLQENAMKIVIARLEEVKGKKAEMETPDEKEQGIHGNVVEEELNELVQSQINTNILKDFERTETPAVIQKAQSEEAQYTEELPKENESGTKKVPWLLFGEDIQLQDYVLDEMVTVILESQPWYKFNFWYGKLLNVLTTAGRASYDFRPDGVHIKEKYQRKIGQLAAKDLIEKYGSDLEVINSISDESKVSELQENAMKIVNARLEEVKEQLKNPRTWRKRMKRRISKMFQFQLV